MFFHFPNLDQIGLSQIKCHIECTKASEHHNNGGAEIAPIPNDGDDEIIGKFLRIDIFMADVYLYKEK